MSEEARSMELAESEARSWFEESLGGGKLLTGGFEVAAEVLTSTAFDRGDFYALVPRDVTPDQIQFPTHPDVPGSNVSLAKYLDELNELGALCLVIEDDVALRKDPGLDKWPVPSAFLGDRVIHWWDLHPGSGEDAVGAIHASAFGYPLNAFVVTQYAADLGLVNGQPVPEDLPKQVSSCLLAIVVAAFDATSFAMWDIRKAQEQQGEHDRPSS